MPDLLSATTTFSDFVTGKPKTVITAALGLTVLSFVSFIYLPGFLNNSVHISPSPDGTQLNIKFNKSGQSQSITISDVIQNRSITITNKGDNLVTNPRIVANGSRNWFSVDTILEEIFTPNMTERKKALAIWKFIVDNRIHDEPAHSGRELHNPVRYLNNYGYGLCDDSATAFMSLGKYAKFKTRVWALNGHVVPEIFYNNDWHMLDPDGEIYYLDDDGHTILGVEKLQQRQDIILQTISPKYQNSSKLAKIYISHEDNSVEKWYEKIGKGDFNMGFVLRPGETLIRSWDNVGLFYSSRNPPVRPRNFGNGRFVLEPIFRNNLFTIGAAEFKGLTARKRNGTRVLGLASGSTNGRLTYRIRSPYPILNGRVTMEGYASKNGAVELKYITPRKKSTFGTTTNSGVFTRTVDLKDILTTGTHNKPYYKYDLSFLLSGKSPSDIYISRIRIESDIQLSPKSLPALEMGQNRIEYIDDTSAKSKIEVSFKYKEM
jgi:hypothetical protein